MIVLKLNQIISNLKTEIEKLKQTKNNYSLNQNTNDQPTTSIRTFTKIL